MTDDADISNPPQVGQESHPPAAGSVPEASNILPAPASLGKTWQSIPDEILLTTASLDESDFSWTTRAAANATSMLPPELPNSLPESRHAYAVRDATPYTEVPLPVGGVPVKPTSPFRQSILTAKDRLSKLSRLDFSTISMSLDIPWDQDGQQDQASQAENRDPSPEIFSTLSTFATVESSMEEDDAFPVSASKVEGKKAGSTRGMGSLEWLNLCSGPPKANLLTRCPLTLLSSCAKLAHYMHICSPVPPVTSPCTARPPPSMHQHKAQHLMQLYAGHMTFRVNGLASFSVPLSCMFSTCTCCKVTVIQEVSIPDTVDAINHSTIAILQSALTSNADVGI